MSRIFGGADNLTSNLYLPLTSCTWNIAGVADRGSYKNIMLVGFSIDDNEAVDIRRCFNDITHIFAFGKNFKASSITTSFICFLGKTCQDGGKTGLAELKDLRKKYIEQSRIYKKLGSLEISVGDFSTKGFLVGMSVQNMDTMHSTCIITFTFIPDEEL